MGGLCLEQDPPEVPGNCRAVLEVAVEHESKELAALWGKSGVLSYFLGNVGDNGLRASFEKNLVFDECCHQVPGTSLAGTLITVLLPRSVFDEDCKRFFQVDDFPIQDMVPHDQHRDSLWQNKNEMPEVQGKIITLTCFLEMLLAGNTATCPPWSGSSIAEQPQWTTHPRALFCPGKRIFIFRNVTF